jgi:hypothetical protein
MVSECTRCANRQHALHVVWDGDYYCRLRLGPSLSLRTRTVFQTADPHFDESWARLTVPHYRASLTVELIDAGYDRAVGRVELPVFKILQRDADALAEGRGGARKRRRRKRNNNGNKEDEGQQALLPEDEEEEGDDYVLRDNQDREVRNGQ